METKAIVKMNIEGMEKLIFTNVHFNMNVSYNPIMSVNVKRLILFADGAEDLSNTAVMGRRRPNKL